MAWYLSDCESSNPTVGDPAVKDVTGRTRTPSEQNPPEEPGADSPAPSGRVALPLPPTPPLPAAISLRLARSAPPWPSAHVPAGKTPQHSPPGQGSPPR